MNIFKRIIGAVVLASVAAVGYGDGSIVESGEEGTIVGSGAFLQCALDLTGEWAVTNFDPVDVPYSAVGWGIEENGAVDNTVTLELTPVAGGIATVVASGLTGRGTNSWDTVSVRNNAYVLRHFVRKSGTYEPIETLEAYLVFERSAVRPLETLAAVAEAAFPDAGRSCAITAMGGASWTAVGLEGDGIAGPATETATLTFALDGIGAFAFEYRCAAGEMLTVTMDGGAEQTLVAAADWTAARFSFGDACEHTVVISATGGDAAVRGVRWDDGESSIGAFTQCALDLSEVWDKRDLDDEPILWSSLGWEDAAEEESGKSVTLRLIPRSGEAQTLASGKKGHRQTDYWTPGEVTKQVYNIRHIVVGGSPLETDLNAYFSFENYDHVAPGEPEVRAAIAAMDGSRYGIANDPDNWWELSGGPGEGIEAPRGESVLAFTVDGRGTFAFDYALGGGTWKVVVDGVEVRTMDAADWTGVELPVDERLVTHVIEFVTELSSGDSAAIKNVRWVDADDCFGGGQGGDAAVDLREGVLVVKRSDELMPFAWSSTNFTGVVEIGPGETRKIDPASVASVRVVQVTGEGEDASLWTAEVANTEKMLVDDLQGEGTVKWKHVKPAVWKAELVIKANGNEAYRETRILDLRNYAGPGLILFVK